MVCGGWRGTLCKVLNTNDLHGPRWRSESKHFIRSDSRYIVLLTDVIDELLP